MASNTLTGVSPASTRQQLLHLGTGSVSAGATIRAGDGTATPLQILAGGSVVAVNGTLQSDAVTVAGIPVRGLQWIFQTTDVSNSTTTGVAIPGISFTPVAGKKYELELVLICSAVATTTGVQIACATGSGTISMYDPANGPGFAAIGTFAAYSAVTGSASAGAKFSQVLRGIFDASGTAALTFQVKSEVSGSSVTVYAGSYLKVTPIN